MWPWRKRSPFEHLGLPKKCFISHSYRDADERDLLLSLLPRDVEAVIFPPITTDPDKLISNHLIDAILDCDGLIYLDGEFSSKSFWVAFERDYALRAGKRVFSFARRRGMLTQDTSPPLELHIFPTWARNDTPRVRVLLDFMRNERFFTPFDLDKLQEIVAADALAGMEVAQGYFDLVNRGGYGVFFWSKHAARSMYFLDDMVVAAETSERVLLALLDNSYYARTIPWKVVSPIQLYGDDQRSEMQRVDDLIVRLYWLIYRNTHQNQLS